MPTVTFYKTNFNRSNRAYDLEALSTILSASTSMTIDIPNQIVPNTPFAIREADTAKGTGQDIILEGYDYISWEYGADGNTKTWYAFIDDIQPLATSLGDVFIYHTIDKWAMALTYYSDRMSLFGSVERAHVNDLVTDEDRNYITLENTTGATEAPFNESLLIRGRSKCTPSAFYYQGGNRVPVYWLYVHYANVNAVKSVYTLDLYATRQHSLSKSTQIFDYSQTHMPATTTPTSYPYAYSTGDYNDNSAGLTACYPAVPTGYVTSVFNNSSAYRLLDSLEELLGSWCIIMPKLTVDYPTTGSFSTVSLNGYIVQGISTLTGENITSMCLSPIPPMGVSYSNNTGTVTTIVGAEDITDGISLTMTVPVMGFTASTTNLRTSNTISYYSSLAVDYGNTENNVSLKSGYPYMLIIPNVITGYNLVTVGNLGGAPVEQYITPTLDYSTYITQIPKYLTTVYNPLYVNGIFINNTMLPRSTTVQIALQSAIVLSYTIDLNYVCLYMSSDLVIGCATVEPITNKGVYASAVTLDYWTRLNAVQSTIAANKTITNAILSPVVSTSKTMLSAASGNAGGVLTGAMNTAGGILNSLYDIESANNLRQVATYQYNTGEYSGETPMGASSIIFGDELIVIDFVSNANNQEMICLNLHRYGYNTFLPIDEIYKNHRRQYFNYFKGVDVSVSGMPQSWCNEIAEMFNSGVTLWHSGVDNYEVCNYQEGV